MNEPTFQEVKNLYKLWGETLAEDNFIRERSVSRSLQIIKWAKKTYPDNTSIQSIDIKDVPVVIYSPERVNEPTYARKHIVTALKTVLDEMEKHT